MMGVMYYKGQGVQQDYVSAHMWFNLAVYQGMIGAIKGRNNVEKQMTTQQISEAQLLARNWKPKHESKSLKESKSFFEQFKEKFGIK
jgi:TPR repeat protein